MKCANFGICYTLFKSTIQRVKQKHYLNSCAPLTDADWADTLPQEVIDGIREGMKQVENGQTIPHSEMKAKHQKQFPHLNL
jgi:hypothetical protein